MAIVPTPTPDYIGFPRPSDVSWNADSTLLAVGSTAGVYLFTTDDFSAPPTLIISDARISELTLKSSCVTPLFGANVTSTSISLSGGEIVAQHRTEQRQFGHVPLLAKCHNRLLGDGDMCSLKRLNLRRLHIHTVPANRRSHGSDTTSCRIG